MCAFRTSVASAASSNHVVVLFQNDVLVVVEVEQGDGEEFVGHATGRAHVFRAHAQRVHDALHRGVVGGLLALTQRERALPRTVVRIVPFGRDDPPGPPDLVEVYVHLVLGTRAAVAVAANVIHSLPPRPLSLPLLAASRPRLPPSSLSALRRGARKGRGRVGTGTCTLVQHQDGLAEVDVSAETGRRGFRDFRFRFCRPGLLL